MHNGFVRNKVTSEHVPTGLLKREEKLLFSSWKISSPKPENLKEEIYYRHHEEG